LERAAPTFAPERIVRETFVDCVEYRHELSSTSDLALQMLQAGLAPGVLLVIADRQTSGRGRGENRWWSDDGAITFTLVLAGSSSELPARIWPQASLVTALAVSDALLDLVPKLEVRLKWPNDVYLQSRKVAGILVESSPSRPGVPIIGVGVNVNNSIAQAPPALQQSAASLCDVTGRTFERVDVLIRILRHLEVRLRELADHSLALPDVWQRLCMLQGRTVSVESGSQKCVGICQGIDDQGALLLQTESGIQRQLTGVVTRIL
jgi:BirA family biotin operon repressor/biotin-[acetyl-CoA-carboxylase] ligase